MVMDLSAGSCIYLATQHDKKHFRVSFGLVSFRPFKSRNNLFAAEIHLRNPAFIHIKQIHTPFRDGLSVFPGASDMI
jgi:hypothetical protein